MLAFREGQTWFHKMDPLTKFGWTCLITIWLMSLRDLPSVIVVSIGVLVIAIFGAGLEIFRYLKVAVPLMLGGIFMIAFQGYFRPGPGIDLLSIHFSYEGMELGLILALRAFGLVASSLAFSRTTRPKSVTLSLVKLGMPYKIAHVAFLALRFLPLLEADMQTIQDAQQIRGVRGGWGKMQKTILALIVTEVRRADETAIALETRGFGLYPTQTVLEQVTISRNGVMLLLITIAALIAHVTWLIVR
jgi:energy-coupling factor transport system permease protein